MTRLALLERLKEVQQMPRYAGRDITTISAVLSNEALAKHVEQCAQAATAPSPLPKGGSKVGHARAA